MGQFRLSASKLKRFLTCPRAYFLRYVAGVEEDVGGSYLAIGIAYDLHVQHYLSAGARGVQSIDPRIVRMFDAARRYLPEPGSVEVQTKYSISHPDGFVVEGTPDLRRRGWLGDTKTTSASGPGAGSAMTAAQLEVDIQFRLYSWCEFELGWDKACVGGTWSYVNKDTKPKAWNVQALAMRHKVYDWFDAVVRPAAAAMAALEAEADADRALANLDSCDRCWVRAHCTPFDGPNNYDGVDVLLPAASLKRTRPVLPAERQTEGSSSMAFDLKRLAEESVDLESPLRASLDEATGGLTMASAPAQFEKHSGVYENGMEWSHSKVLTTGGTAIPINPPTTTAAEDLAKARAFLASESAVVEGLPKRDVDYATELAEAIAQCQSAASRAAGLLARLRGGGA